VVPLAQQGEVEASVAVYLNRCAPLPSVHIGPSIFRLSSVLTLLLRPSASRLSDFLFVAARYSALKEGRAEVLYKKGAATE
jgi:cob(I)alamin adenosyltransferase